MAGCDLPPGLRPDPKGTGPLASNWRQDLCRREGQERRDHDRTLQAIETRSLQRSVRRRSTDPLIVSTLQRLRRRVSEIDSSRSSAAEPDTSQNLPRRGVTKDAREDPPESWRRYAAQRGETERIARRVQEILEKPPNASKVNNKMHFGSHDTGYTVSQVNYQHGRPFAGISYDENALRLSGLVPDSGRAQRAAEIEQRRLTNTELKRRSTSVLGLYRNVEVPTVEPPLLSPLYPTDAAVSNNDASYNISQFPAHMRAVPNAEQLLLTHADIHAGVNRMLPRRKPSEKEYRRYKPRDG